LNETEVPVGEDDLTSPDVFSRSEAYTGAAVASGLMLSPILAAGVLGISPNKEHERGGV